MSYYDLQKLSDDLFNLGSARGNIWLQSKAKHLVGPGMPPSAGEIAEAAAIVGHPSAAGTLRSMDIALGMVK